MRGSHAQSRRLWSAMVLVVFACAALPAAASADPGKPYTLNIAPASVPAGTHATFSATFSNPAGAQQQLGSANVTVPAGLVVRSASVPGPATATVSGNAVQVRGMSLTAGNSLTVSVVADAPCSPGVLAWTVQAKQANDFKGPPGNDMTLAQPSSLTTTVSGQCRLQFATQPANARVGEAISGTPYAPGPPVSVEIVDGAGARVTGSSANVTVAPGAGSAAGTLTGTTTAATVLGAASFSDLALSAPGAYTLVASSPGLASATSAAFKIDTVATFCAEDLTCTGSTSSGPTKADVTALGTPTNLDAGFLTLSFNAGPAIDCAGYQEISPDTVLVDFSSPNRTKQATLTFDKKLMNASPNNGASFMQFCFGSPQPFVTRTGVPSPQQGTFDWDGNGTADPVYVGLLPDCNAGAPPCVTTRNKTGAGDGVIGALIPAGLGDPGMRG